MIPGMNQRQMRQMMQRMGVQQQEIDATEVIILTKDKEIRFENPSVSAVNMMGQKTYQIVGEPTERPLDSKPEVSDDDVETVMEQANVSRDEAIKAIEESEGDLAEAIMNLQNKE
ncbi:MAG: nascent polypeptide-associated complex protein [Candidatus Woesearchaeota archaeon]